MEDQLEKNKEAEIAIVAGGCFWGIEHNFNNTPGVLDAVSGYIGGHKENPTYREVCGGRTGHAEAVRITYDPTKISYEEIIVKFFEMHDPTQVNRQGPDVGTQYRTGIFYLNEEQEKIAEKVKANLENSKRFSKPVATEVTPATTFYKAEEYHQRYFTKNGLSGCALH